MFPHYFFRPKVFSRKLNIRNYHSIFIRRRRDFCKNTILPVFSTIVESKTKRRGDEVDVGGNTMNHTSNRCGDGNTTSSCTPHPGIRTSLFPNVPSYVRFTAARNALKQLPLGVRKLLRWRNSKMTPLVVKKVVQRSGFNLQEECKCWSGTWTNQMKSTAYRHLQDCQKFNHFPGTYQIGRKDYLWRNIQRMKTKHGEKAFNIMPSTYILPEDKKAFRLRYQKSMNNQFWIVKPPACYRGDGIKIVHKYKQIPKTAPMIVQKYVQNPYLINGNKFDLRLYVLVTSINPLRVYLYEEGLVRFASVKYSAAQHTLGERYMHLTNYSVNKFNEKYESNSDTEACKGHKWTLKTLWKYLRTEHRVNVEEVWNSLVDLVVKTMISVEEPLYKTIAGSLRSRYNSFELFGFDVLLDSNLRPWLLEVNVSPSLHSSSALDKVVKANLVQDTLNVVGFHIPINKSASQELGDLNLTGEPKPLLCYDNRIYTPNITNSERYKHFTFVGKASRNDYIERILQELNPDDVRCLIIHEDEQTQLGAYQKIFPTHETFKYLKFFEKKRYYNLLLDAWETKYHRHRSQGIHLLKKLCHECVHLKVPRKGEVVKLFV